MNSKRQRDAINFKIVRKSTAPYQPIPQSPYASILEELEQTLHSATEDNSKNPQLVSQLEGLHIIAQRILAKELEETGLNTNDAQFQKSEIMDHMRELEKIVKPTPKE